MRRTKIICTMGPATDDVSVLDKLIKTGMDVARFNFSHGTYEEQQRRMDSFREIRRKYQRPVAMLLDTKGPEIRLGDFAAGRVQLQRGQRFILSVKNVIGNEERASVSYANLVGRCTRQPHSHR